MKRTTLTARGLMTDANALAAGPMGGLRQAENVAIERPGTITCRPGFFNASEKDTGFRIRTMAPFDGEMIYQSADSVSEPTWRLEYDGDEYNNPSEEVTPIDPSISFSQFAEARKNLYVNSSYGALKICDVSDDAFVPIDMHEAQGGYFQISNFLTVGRWLATTRRVAYQVCWTRTDANGVLFRTAPSPWQQVQNGTGTDGYGHLSIFLPEYVVEGDVIEVYRSISVASAATPPAVLYLCFTHQITTADLTSTSGLLGLFDLTDTLPEDQLGAELYTNDTREGFAKANVKPPASIAMCQFANCMWFGGIIGPWGGSFRFTKTENTTDDAAVSFKIYETTYAAVSGGTTMTGIPSTASVVVGQKVTEDGERFGTHVRIPSNTTVVSKTATTVTVDKTVTGTGAVFFHDAVVITADGVAMQYTMYDDTGLPPNGGSGLGQTSTGVGDGNFGLQDTPATTGLALTSAIAGTSIYSTFPLDRQSLPIFGLVIEDPYSPSVRSGYYRTISLPSLGDVLIRNRRIASPTFTISFLSAGIDSIQFSPNADGDVTIDRDDLPNAVAYSNRLSQSTSLRSTTSSLARRNSLSLQWLHCVRQCLCSSMTASTESPAARQTTGVST